MSKILAFLSCIILIVVITITAFNESNEMIFDFGNMEQKHCRAFLIPDIQELNDPDALFSVLRNTAEETKSNIIRSFFKEGTEKRSYVYYKYILIKNNDGNYLKGYELKDGDNLVSEDTDSINSALYLSTINSKDQNQKGLLKSHMIGFELNISPLGKAYDNFKADGVYYVELGEQTDYDIFINTLSVNIEKATMIHLTNVDLTCQMPNSYVPYTDVGLLRVSFLVLFLLWGICVFYFILRSKPEISIMKMMGTNVGKIYIKLFFVPMLIPPILILITLLLAIYRNGLQYALNIAYKCITTYFLTMIFSAAFFLLCEGSTEFSYAIKGKKYTKGVLMAQLFAECIFTIFLLSSADSYYYEIKDLHKKLDIYKNWEKADDYGVFSPFYVGDELTEEEEILRDIKIGTDFYYELNKRGALLIDAGDYEDISLSLDPRPEYQRFVYVNPNYLQIFPWHDVDGRAISISEDEKNAILLIPERIRNREDEIIEYYTDTILRGSFEYDKSHYESIPMSIPEVSVVWTKNDQSLFSFNVEISAESEGIYDPIISVLTEKNSFITDRIRSYGSGYRDPRKIPITGNVKETYEELEPILKACKLDDNFARLVSINGLNAEKLGELKLSIRRTTMSLVFIILILLLIIYQSTVVVFDMNKKNYCIRRMFGIPKRKIYNKYIICKIIMGVIETVAYAIVFKRGNPIYNTATKFYVSTGIIIVLAQIFLILIFMEVQQRKRQAEILKGQ